MDKKCHFLDNFAASLSALDFALSLMFLQVSHFFLWQNILAGQS